MRLIVLLLLLMLAPGGAMPACAAAPVAAPMMHHTAMEMAHHAPARPEADHCRADACLGCAIEAAPLAAPSAPPPIAMLPALATTPVRLRGVAPPIVSPPPRLG